jgi:hypothetical protein
MVAYLSDEWIAALDAALAPRPATSDTTASARPRPRPEEAVTVEYRVDDGPAGPRAWFLELSEAGVRARSGHAPHPAVTFAQSWRVAVAVARGERGARDAVLTGEMQVTGDPTTLLAWRDRITEAQERIAALAAVTEFVRVPVSGPCEVADRA